MPPKKKDEENKKKDTDEINFNQINFQSKDPQTLYHLLFSKEENILWKACDALYNFSQLGESNRSELCSMGTVKAAIPHLSSTDPATRRSSVMLINSLSQLEETKEDIRDKEVVTALINLLKPEEGVMTHEHSTKCLHTIADQFSTKSMILECGGVELLVNLVNDEDPLVQQNTIETMILLAEDCQCRIALDDANVIPALLESLKSEYPVIQNLVLKCLYVVCQEECVRSSVKEVNGLETLLNLLKDEELTDLHEGLIEVVGICMVDTSQLDSMKDSGCLATLTSYVTSANPSGQLNALRAISTAATKEDNARILHDNEIETTIMSVLGGDNPAVLSQACKSVSTMCANPLCKETFTKAGVVQALMKLVLNEDVKVQEMSTLSLANLSLNNKVVCLDIIQDENIDQVIEVLETGTSPRTLTYLCHVVFNLVKDEALREEIIGLNVIPSLAACLTNVDSDVCVAACKALAALVPDQTARDELLKTNALGSLVSLLKQSQSNEVVRKAAWTISICVANEAMAKELNKNGALKVLMDMSNDGSNSSNLAVVALEKLLQYDLTAKFWYKGELGQTDMIKDGFYDTGAHKPGEAFKALKYHIDRKVDNKRAVLFISTVGSDPEPVDLKSESSTTGSSTNIKPGGRNTAKGKKSHKSTEDKKEEPPAEPEIPKETRDPTKPRVDMSLREYVEDVTTNILPLPTQEEQVKALAVFVANQMGGPVQDISHFSWDMHIAQLKSDLKSNVLPIGFIKRGIFYHRALLFKALADRIGVPCTLVRGEYNRAWNNITLVNNGKFKHYVVDLMYEPGKFLEVGGYLAGVYKKL